MALREAIVAAQAADDAFSASIRAEFGPKASRWDRRPPNATVDAAFAVKVAADKAMGEAFARA